MALACTQQLPQDMEGVNDTGKLSVVLYTEDDMVQSKSTVSAEFVPELEDLKVEVFKNPGPDQVRLYRDSYKNTLSLGEGGIPLNCADYRVLASYGDSLGVGFTADKIYYAGKYDFTLQPDEEELAEVIVRPSNVRASVRFGENLNFDYSGFYAKVRSQTKGGKVKSLRFDYDETRAGYLPAGMVRVELYVKINGEELYCPGPDLDIEGGTDITFNVETIRQESEIAFEITVSQPDRTDKSYTVPAVMLPKDSPQIDMVGLTEFAYILEPGDEPLEGLRMDIKADGTIAHCWMDIESEYLAGLGVPSRIDLADAALGMEDAAEAEDVTAVLESVGLRWMSGMEGSRLAYVDFSGVTEFISSTPCTPAFDADFTVELVDARQEGTQHVGNIKTDTYSFVQVIPAPAIKTNGFDGFKDSKVYILEGNGVTYDAMTAELEAKGRIKHCWLNIDSPYLKTAGVSETRIDLANIDEEGTIASALRTIGVSWTPSMAGKSAGLVDFSGVSRYMDTHWYDGRNARFANMSLSLEAEHYAADNDKTVNTDLADFQYVVPIVTIKKDVLPGNVWARKILDFAADCSIDDASGIQLDSDLFKIQYKSGNDWVDVPSTSYEYPTRSCPKFDSQSETEYQFRAIYNNNPNLVAEFATQTTESESQIEGADFNNWERNTFTYYAVKIAIQVLFWTVDCGGDIYLDRDYYQPLPSSWWAINSKKTMPDKTTPNFTINAFGFNYETGDTQTYKVFPTISKCVVDQAERNYGAQVATIHVCNMATEGNSGDGGLGQMGGSISGVERTEYLAAGELCIGSADASGNLTYGGHQFASRPTKVKVRYQYDSYDNEKGYMKFELKAGNEVIATHVYETAAVSEWTEYTFDVPYTDLQKKATSVFVTLKSTSKSTPSFKGDGARTITMENTDYKVHSGSVLRIDDMTLIYE